MKTSNLMVRLLFSTIIAYISVVAYLWFYEGNFNYLIFATIFAFVFSAFTLASQRQKTSDAKLLAAEKK